jgi:hypothetical protein
MGVAAWEDLQDHQDHQDLLSRARASVSLLRSNSQKGCLNARHENPITDLLMTTFHNVHNIINSVKYKVVLKPPHAIHPFHLVVKGQLNVGGKADDVGGCVRNQAQSMFRGLQPCNIQNFAGSASSRNFRLWVIVSYMKIACCLKQRSSMIVPRDMAFAKTFSLAAVANLEPQLTYEATNNFL